jgi:hypothetical protein
MLVQLQAGAIPTQSNKSGQNNAAQGWLNETLVSETLPQYSTLNQNGFLFSAFVNAVTLAATHASPLAAGTGTPIISIYNPLNSGKNVHLVKTKQTTTSGTPGGPLLWNIVPNPANITSASASPVSNIVGGGAASVVKCWNNSAVTGSTAGTAYRALGGTAAVAAGAGIYSHEEEHKGDLIIPPGTMMALCCTAAGTTHIISAWCEWAEMPI